jgi:hypothetical protein
MDFASLQDNSAAACADAPPPPRGGDPANTRMSDGRHFTDWTPRGSGWMAGSLYPHPALSASRGAQLSSHDMKDRLVSEGAVLMEADREAAAAAVSGAWCDALKDLPGFETVQHCGEFSCSFAAPEAVGASGAGRPPGTGIGRA